MNAHNLAECLRTLKAAGRNDWTIRQRANLEHPKTHLTKLWQGIIIHDRNNKPVIMIGQLPDTNRTTWLAAICPGRQWFDGIHKDKAQDALASALEWIQQYDGYRIPTEQTPLTAPKNDTPTHPDQTVHSATSDLDDGTRQKDPQTKMNKISIAAGLAGILVAGGMALGIACAPAPEITAQPRWPAMADCLSDYMNASFGTYRNRATQAVASCAAQHVSPQTQQFETRDESESCIFQEKRIHKIQHDQGDLIAAAYANMACLNWPEPISVNSENVDR